MVACINRSLSEYQSLKNMAGIPQTILDFWCQYFLTKFNRFPYLDELPGVNSEQHLKDKLKVKQVGNSQISEVNSLYELTGINSFSESIIKLNNVYKDLQIQGVDLGNGKFFIDIVHRPTEENKQDLISYNYEKTSVNDKTILVNSLMKLQKYYGINIIPISTDDINLSKEFQQLPEEAKLAKAFIFNGNIYLNTDFAGIQSPIHELLHIFLGGMRYTNPGQYIEIISKLNTPNIDELQNMFGIRSEQDLLEEYFVTEFAKFLCGQATDFSKLNQSDIQILIYNITRNIDSILMGETSVKTIPIDELVNNSLLDLAINSKSEIINQIPISNLNLANIHRKISNIKSKLLQNGDLTQICE